MMSERLEYRPVTAATLDDFHGSFRTITSVAI